ncbi:hypothetical protein Nepgr_017791 [Nepenthes gracilis]|uniref:Glycosyl transferase family 1 domain-containing protein n=1 Tax=Nepenthes gracilis TaxID=150966 RepID=A0AAD3SQ18_NEPGR|nr:hypothetical protein Nepgr_017791 [Nepenthes gracilis]
MEESNEKKDLQGNLERPSSLKPVSILKPTLSGRSTPRASPTFRRVHSSRTPRKEGRSGVSCSQWFRSNRLLYWLLLITLWTYGGFYIQSRWAHGNNQENFVGFGSKPNNEVVDSEENHQRKLSSDKDIAQVRNETSKSQVGNETKMLDNKYVVLARKGNDIPSHPKLYSRKRGKRSGRGLQKKTRRKQKMNEEIGIQNRLMQEEEIPKRNTSYGSLLGPFGSTEDRILEWSPEKRRGTCDRTDLFARLVWSRNFVLIFHELSMTGAPLSMLELATELLSCGATVNAVVLSKKGGLMSELARRRIKLIDDKLDHSFKAAMKADLVIAGSAICASWIEQYLAYFAAGSNQIAWWIMENRHEYFDRSKRVLNRVKMLIFLSELQSNQWLTWCEDENIKLTTPTSLIPLSVNDELAFVAGIACSLNTPAFSPEKMLEKQQMLRNAVRQEMGLTDDDMLVISLSSINAAKGQLLLLESAHLIVEEQTSRNDVGIQSSLSREHIKTTMPERQRLKGLLHKLNQTRQFSTRTNLSYRSMTSMNEGKRRMASDIRKLDFDDEQPRKQNLKILIGSVGSKSNKVIYVKEILRFLSRLPNLSKSVLWTPSTTRVASLYSAADVYVINSQGLGETFGRVTIEAMAFGLPVLGTDAGGTKEIVENNVTGLLHPIGRQGTKLLAENLRFLLENPSVRQQMGLKGREKIEKMYLKRHMYKMFFEVLFKCLRIK